MALDWNTFSDAEWNTFSDAEWESFLLDAVASAILPIAYHHRQRNN